MKRDPSERRPPPLSPELARSVAVNNTIIVAVGNFATLEFVRSWAYHVRKQGKCRPAWHVVPACLHTKAAVLMLSGRASTAGYTNWLVGATDSDFGHALVSEGIPAFAL